MLKNVIKYVGLALVLIGIVLVMKNLFTSDSDWNNARNKNGYYSVKISLLDKETKSFISGANLILKDEDGNIVKRWITENKVHTIEKLTNGKYILNQETTLENYHLNEDDIEFEIKGEDKTVVMYNIALTKEEIEQREDENRKNNTTSNDVNVENTASNKSILTNIIAIISIVLGIFVIYFQRKREQL